MPAKTGKANAILLPPPPIEDDLTGLPSIFLSINTTPHMMQIIPTQIPGEGCSPSMKMANSELNMGWIETIDVFKDAPSVSMPLK